MYDDTNEPGSDGNRSWNDTTCSDKISVNSE